VIGPQLFMRRQIVEKTGLSLPSGKQRANTLIATPPASIDMHVCVVE
jgi:hypothetical protein